MTAVPLASLLSLSNGDSGWRDNIINLSSGHTYSVENVSDSKAGDKLTQAISDAKFEDVLYLPSRVYKGTQTVDKTVGLFSFFNQGAMLHSESGHALTVYLGTKSATAYKSSLRNIGFRTPKNSEYDAIHVRGSESNVDFINCHVYEAGHDGIHIESGVSVVRFENCVVSGANDIGHYSVYINGNECYYGHFGNNARFAFGPEAGDSAIVTRHPSWESIDNFGADSNAFIAPQGVNIANDRVVINQSPSKPATVKGRLGNERQTTVEHQEIDKRNGFARAFAPPKLVGDEPTTIFSRASTSGFIGHEVLVYGAKKDDVLTQFVDKVLFHAYAEAKPVAGTKRGKSMRPKYDVDQDKLTAEIGDGEYWVSAVGMGLQGNGC